MVAPKEQFFAEEIYEVSAYPRRDWVFLHRFEPKAQDVRTMLTKRWLPMWREILLAMRGHESQGALHVAPVEKIFSLAANLLFSLSDGENCRPDYD